MKRRRFNCSNIQFALLLTMIVAASAALSQDNAKVPAKNSTTNDGFTVFAVWHAHYSYEWVSHSTVGARAENYGGCGEGTPINDSENKDGTAYINEEVNNKTGETRAVVRGGDWSWKREHDDECNSKKSNQDSSGGGFALAHVSYFTNSSNGKRTVHFDVAAGNPTQGKRQWGSPLVCEAVVSEGEISCHQDDTDSGVSGLAHWNSETHLLITRHAGPVDAVLVTPRGNPKMQARTAGDGQNMYTFDQSHPGRLIVNFKARTIPPGRAAELYQKTKFKIDPIGSSKMTWDAANPNGQASKSSGDFLTARLTLTGLPDSNSGFGVKTVQLLIDGNTRDTALPEIFFPKWGRNHPGGVMGDPNWFYYWKEGNVCGIAPKDIYDGSKDHANDWGYTDPEHDTIIRLCPLAPQRNSGPEVYKSGTKNFGSITVAGHGKGIKCVAETMQHEGHHIAIYNMFKSELAKPGVDPDADEIPTMEEPTLDAINSDMRDPDTFKMGGDYATYGDNEVRCRKVELDHTVEYHPEKDWAWPGCQSKPPYGP